MQFRALSFLSLAVVLAGCTAEADSTVTSQQQAQPIDVATVLETDYSPTYTFTTRLESPQQVELRPRISGVVETVEFREGSEVQKGALLFRIDPRPFKAEVERLKSELKRASVALKQAQSEARRAKRLQARSAMSAEEAESRLSLASQRQAELASVQAALEAARLNLEFTRIEAPISGRVSSAYITAGNNVQARQSLLTSLVATDRLYAYFDIDERTWNEAFADITADGNTQVSLTLMGREQEPHQGRLDFIDNSIDPRTGTLRVRAIFDATSAPLRPGAFARIQLKSGAAQPRVMVPDRAIGTDLKNRFVLVINEQNLLEYRQVTPGQREGALRVIESGLQPGDRIAVNGPARVGPGMPVTPREVQIQLPGGNDIELTTSSEPSA